MSRRVLRVSLDEQRQRLSSLRDEMERIGTEPPPAEEPTATVESLASVLEDFIRERLKSVDLRHPESTALLRAGVALIAVTDKRGSGYGSELYDFMKDAQTEIA